MREATHALLQRVALPAGPILELGCGAATFLAELATDHPQRLLAGIDHSQLAIQEAARKWSHQPKLAQADLHHLPFASSLWAAIIALDAFDQQGVDLGVALAESWRALVSGGYLLLRVSAYPWLQGPHDRAFGTGRRYRQRDLEAQLAATGFRIHALTHANTLMLLPGAALRIMQRLRGLELTERELASPPGVNSLLQAVLGIEARWLRNRDLWAGMSLYALAQRDD